MQKMLHFLQYHNAVPLAVTILVMGAGATFAATDPQAIYNTQQQVVSVDNTYIASKDLSAYQPRVQITQVTEDGDNYYVGYKLYTIDVDNYVWKDVVKDELITVSKADLGPYRDLGVYVTQQLRQTTERELARLVDTQDIEKRSISQKIVATTYGGLVGKFLDPSTETLPGYTPVVTAPSDSQTASAAVPEERNGGTQTTTGSGGSSAKIGLQLLGNNPARVALRDSFIDLGAVLIDPFNTNVGVHAFLDGVEVVSPSIDTSTSSVHTVEYRATDPDGSKIMVRRIILIGDVSDPGGEISEAGQVTPPQAAVIVDTGTASAPAAPAPVPTEAATSTPTRTTAATSTPRTSEGTTTVATSTASTDPAAPAATSTAATTTGTTATTTGTTTAADTSAPSTASSTATSTSP